MPRRSASFTLFRIDRRFQVSRILEKSQLLKGQYAEELGTLRAQLESMQMPAAPDVQPQRFQDDLRAAVNLITEKAAAAGVELPERLLPGFQSIREQPSE